jgi:hypothetical protein
MTECSRTVNAGNSLKGKFLRKVLLPEVSDILRIPSFGLDVVGECGGNVFGGENLSSRERTEDMWRCKEDIPIVECEVHEEVVGCIELISEEEICFQLVSQPDAFRFSTVETVLKRIVDLVVDVVGREMVRSLEHEISSCREQVTTPCCVGEFPEDAFGNVQIIRDKESFERVCARRSVWTAINNGECQMQQDVGVDNGDSFL